MVQRGGKSSTRTRLNFPERYLEATPWLRKLMMSEERLRASTGSLCFPGRTAVDTSAVRRPTDAVGGRHGLGTKAKPLGACSVATAALLSDFSNRTEMDVPSVTVAVADRAHLSFRWLCPPAGMRQRPSLDACRWGHFLCVSGNIRKIERAWQIANSLDCCGTATARIGFSS
jgi:hypothetical protein